MAKKRTFPVKAFKVEGGALSDSQRAKLVEKFRRASSVEPAAFFTKPLKVAKKSASTRENVGRVIAHNDVARVIVRTDVRPVRKAAVKSHVKPTGSVKPKPPSTTEEFVLSTATGSGLVSFDVRPGSKSAPSSGRARPKRKV